MQTPDCGEQIVKVDLSRPYEIHVGYGLLTRLPKTLSSAGVVLGDCRAVVVSDETVGRLWLDPLSQAVGTSMAGSLLIPGGEGGKSLVSAGKIYDFLIDRHCDRDTVVLALGGGVVGDVAGYAAATYLRGIRVVQLPTTLLAQVDASIGGKVAVNHPAGKNLIGSFHQPSAVVADLQTLATLPEAVYREGLAEVVKTAIVGGEDLVSLLEENAEAVLSRDPALMTMIVTCCARVKANLVEADERDTGQRMALNLGHTFAHAIEVAAGFGAVSHGHAVSVGLSLAAVLAEETDFAQLGLARRTRSMLRALGLPTTLADLPIALSAAKLVEHLQQDKKRRDGSVRYVLARAPGDIVVRGDLDAGRVVSVLLRSERGELN